MIQYSDVTFLEYDQQATVAGTPAVYAHFTATHPNGVVVVGYGYLLFPQGVKFQAITFILTKDSDSFLKANIEAVKSSIKFAQ